MFARTVTVVELGSDNVTVKAKFLVPLSPSVRVTSFTETVAAPPAVHWYILMSSRYQPSLPPQPSTPNANRTRTLSPGWPMPARSRMDVPQLPRLEPSSAPVKAC